MFLKDNVEKKISITSKKKFGRYDRRHYYRKQQSSEKTETDIKKSLL